MRSTTESKEVVRWRTFFISSPFTLVATLVVLVVGGVVGMLIPSIVSKAISAANVLTLGETLGILTPTTIWVLVISTLVLVLIIALRQDELAAAIVIAIHIYLDWYLALRVVALLMVLVLLLYFSLSRSPRYPWIEPPALWLWAAFLVLTVYPAVQGGLTLFDTLNYYPNDVFGALIMFWLGTLIARDTATVRRFFRILSALGTLFAIHAIIQATTGIFLFASSHFAAIYSSAYLYQFGENNVQRLGSFFIDPNYNGTFFAVMAFIPLGLFVESPAFLEKIFYLAETLLILLALLLTYSAGAVITVIVSIFVFFAFVGRTSYRVQIPLFVGITAAITVVLLQTQINSLLIHATTAYEVPLRVGAWLTAVQIMLAFPLTGIGLGGQAYQQRAEPYRVPAQYIPLEHPHNAYLEWGAMAGIPVLIVFLALLVFALWLAFHNWRLADSRTRSLFGGGITSVLALSINSVSINGWTLPALAATGWLILGVISSPLLKQSLTSAIEQGKSINTAKKF